MSEQSQPFSIEDVEAAWFAYRVQQCIDERIETPESYIRDTWPELPEGTYEILGIEPQLPLLLKRYEHGASVLAVAEVVSKRVVGDIVDLDYEDLGEVDSPIWIDDQGHVPLPEPKGKQRPRTDEEWMLWGQRRGPRLRYLRALRTRRPASQLFL